MEGIKLSNTTLLLLTIAVVLPLYSALLLMGSAFNFDLFPHTPHGLTFNSMLDYLLRGRFDMDPAAIGDEGFLRDGRVYAYWGVVPALFRLPLLPFETWVATDVTGLSCIAAACLAALVKVLTILMVRRHCPPSGTTDLVCLMLLVYIVLGGPQVAHLKASLYQEVVFWASAWASAFVYCAIRGIVLNRFDHRFLAWMALLSGLALLTRVSTGFGLCAALALLLLALVFERTIRPEEGASQGDLAGRLIRAAACRRILVPAAILGLFVACAAAINLQRWGDPWTFADYSLYIINGEFPDRLPRMREYGLFNASRIPFALGYYVAPFWVLRGPDGRLMFEDLQTRLFDAVELPPSSFLLTDLLPLALVAMLAVRSARLRSVVSVSRASAIALGLSVPCWLMLMAISANYRYRMDFYPLIDFLALLAFYVVSINAWEVPLGPGGRWLLAGTTVISVASAQVMWLLYRLSPFGPAQLYLRQGAVGFYAGELSKRLF